MSKSIEVALDNADKIAKERKERYTHKDVFSKLRESVNKKINN